MVGVEVSVRVGVVVGVPVNVAVEVGVQVGDSVRVGVWVGVPVNVAVEVGVQVHVGVGVAQFATQISHRPKPALQVPKSVPLPLFTNRERVLAAKSSHQYTLPAGNPTLGLCAPAHSGGKGV
jgi:hypothetical protein